MRKKKRLFIAINLPENIKNKIEASLDEISYLFSDDVRFIEKKQWHITLTFLGYQNYESLPSIIKAMRKTIKNFSAPEIKFIDLDYGPKDGTKRMIWLNADVETSSRLATIKDKLEDDLMDGEVLFKKEFRKMRAHIILVRFLTRKNLPDIVKKLSLDFQANSLDLMESHLKRTGVEYEVLERVPFT